MPLPSSLGFRGNSKIKKVGIPFEYTQFHIDEFIKCKEDIFYFIENYFKIVVEDGLEIMKLRDYQYDTIKSMLDNRFTMMIQSRQSGKTEAVRAFICWYVIFNDYKTVAIVANKEATATEILSKIQLSYENLPIWLQQAVTDFNKKTFVLENESRIISSATSSDSLRGITAHVIFIDECAHVDNWDDFYAAVQPTISAGKQTKLIMASTPKGLNHFYQFYLGSSLKENTNGFTAFYIPWWKVPGRDETWKKNMLAELNNNVERFAQEYSCEWQGSSGTLIAGWALNYLKDHVETPEFQDEHTNIYEAPIKEVINGHWEATRFIEEKIPPHKYVLVGDVSRGKGLDYSAFSVFDITKIPYRQVCVYRNNEIAPRDYADIIHRMAGFYNNALVLVEINDIGEQIGDLLINDLEYENVLLTESAGRNSKKVVFSGNKTDKGIRTTTPIKNSGCLLLKLLVEQQKIILPDVNTVNELLTFSKVKNSYKAEKDKFDDLAMGLVLFAWLSDTRFFKDATDIHTIDELRERTLEDIKSELLPFGYFEEPRIPLEYEFYPTSINLNNQWTMFEDRPPAKIVPNF
jgi:hypothetical protein